MKLCYLQLFSFFTLQQINSLIAEIWALSGILFNEKNKTKQKKNQTDFEKALKSHPELY